MGRVASKQQAQRLEAEQQPAGHLVGSHCADHVLVHRQNVSQAAIERSPLIDGCATCRLLNELHYLDASANGMRIQRRKQS